MTPNLSLPFIQAAQSQKHVTANEAFAGIDALAQISVIDRDLNTPPASPADGDTYIIGGAPTGAWSGQTQHTVTYYYNGVWYFAEPNAGWIAYVANETPRFKAFDGSAWVNLSTLT